MSEKNMNQENKELNAEEMEKVAGGEMRTWHCENCGAEVVLHYVDICARYHCFKCGHDGEI